VDLTAEPLSLDERLLRGQVTVQVNIAHDGAFSVRHLSPALPFSIGADARACNFVIAKRQLAVDRICLFELRSELVFLSPAAASAGATITVGRRHLPLRIQIGRASFDLAWSEDPELLAQWAAPEVTNFNKKYGHSVRCTGVVPVRMHCSSCGLDLAGTVSARGTGRDVKRAVAELEARRKAAENAANDAKLSVCASCGHWLTGSVRWLWLALALQLCVVLGVALCLWLRPHTRALFLPLGLVGIVAAVKCGENVVRWRAGARRRFAASPSRGA
jgi:hypothetical protein